TMQPGDHTPNYTSLTDVTASDAGKVHCHPYRGGQQPAAKGLLGLPNQHPRIRSSDGTSPNWGWQNARFRRLWPIREVLSE
ncbi:MULTISPECIES: hypothetical protein, partial [unclassified Blastomonas]|uniref:hypothetical protein n=1 Tax=unclassified Blastomonas TaxID=2626550 RepID=UPI001E4CB03D